jgi:hypothetical protein
MPNYLAIEKEEKTMFVKWAKRKLADQSRFSLDAILVKNQWENGKVKQRYVCYLGSIREDRINRTRYLLEFWRSVDKNLKRLGLSPDQQQLLEQNIQKKVRKTYASEIEDYFDLKEMARRQLITREQKKKPMA